MKKTYSGDQYDDVEKLLDDAEKLLSNPNTVQEGVRLHSIAKTRIQRERNRIAYASLTGQKPNIPPLEPGNPNKLLPDKT
jgi:hypothetical protein